MIRPYGIPIGFFTTALLLCACGSIADPANHGKPLWTIQCRIYVAQEGIDTTHLRAAFLWLSEYDLSNQTAVAYLAQDVPVDIRASAKFALQLYDLPPEKAMHPAQDLFSDIGQRDLQAASGFLLFYDDRNKNGRLDMLPPEAQTPIDYVLGPAEGYYLDYFEGDVSGLQDIDTGLNVFQYVVPGNNLQKVPLTSELTVTLYDATEMQYLMCRQMPPYQQGGTQEEVVDPTQIPYGVQITCSDDGRSLEYSYTKVTQQGGVCSELFEIQVHATSSIPQDHPPPTGWPCGVK